MKNPCTRKSCEGKDEHPCHEVVEVRKIQPISNFFMSHQSNNSLQGVKSCTMQNVGNMPDVDLSGVKRKRSVEEPFDENSDEEVDDLEETLATLDIKLSRVLEILETRTPLPVATSRSLDMRSQLTSQALPRSGIRSISSQVPACSIQITQEQVKNRMARLNSSKGTPSVE